MAEASISVSQDEFSCSICLHMMKDPATIPCGHSFCMDCIRHYWDHEDQGQVCKCPLCKRNFAQRPVLGRNTILAEMLVKMKKKGFQPCPPTNSCAAPGDIACDFCLDQKQKAVLKCLKCLASFCETHAKPHLKSTVFESHPLIKISKRSWKTCAFVDHGPCDIFCIDDQECLCLYCADWLHKGHVIVSAEEELPRKQLEIEEKMMKHKQKILERTKELQELRKAVDTIKRSALTAVQDSEKIFTGLIGSIEKRRTAMTSLIRAQEKADLGRLTDFIKQVSVEITMLKEKYADLEQLLKTKDVTTFLETSKNICLPIGSESLPSVSINTNSFYEKMNKLVQKLKQSMENMLQVDFDKMSVQPDPLIVSPEPLIRQDFLKYTSHIEMDINTAYKHLKLSDGNKQMTWSDEALPYPKLPQRFCHYNQVLGKKCLSVPSYWEVEWRGENGVNVAVTYVGIKRHPCDTRIMLGYNDLSWSLECSPKHFCFRHNYTTREIAPSSNRVGVYVGGDDYDQTLSFYSVSDTMKLLHKEKVKFEQLIYPALWVGVRSKAKLC